MNYTFIHVTLVAEWQHEYSISSFELQEIKARVVDMKVQCANQLSMTRCRQDTENWLVKRKPNFASNLLRVVSRSQIVFCFCISHLYMQMEVLTERIC
jgi:hypothetical protein